jgi:uncharacterized protein (AIM24 family)
MSESARRGPPPLPNAAGAEEHPHHGSDGTSPSPPSVRRPAVAVPNPFAPPTIHMPPPAELHTRTLAPPEPPEFSAPIPKREPLHRESLTRPSPSLKDPEPTIETQAPSSDLAFPERGLRVLPSGVAALGIANDFSFAARLDAIVACHAELRRVPLERHHRGKSTGEPFGGELDPVVLVEGHGPVLLSPRRGRRLARLELQGETCFLHEVALVGFFGELTYDNGRLTTSQDAWLPLVQLAGTGPILVEDTHDIVSMPISPAHAVTVRSASLLGWSGSVLPKAIAPEDAPSFQPNLVRLSGTGRVFLRTQRAPASFESDAGSVRG